MSYSRCAVPTSEQMQHSYACFFRTGASSEEVAYSHIFKQLYAKFSTLWHLLFLLFLHLKGCLEEIAQSDNAAFFRISFKQRVFLSIICKLSGVTLFSRILQSVFLYTTTIRKNKNELGTYLLKERTIKVL